MRTWEYRSATGLDRDSDHRAGLLVDDPVVATTPSSGNSRGDFSLNAAWLGPTKLARAILYATATNIIGVSAFSAAHRSTGDFLTAPVVMTCALVSSRLASMTFIPLLGYYLLRPPKKARHDRRTPAEGFLRSVLQGGAGRHPFRWLVLAFSLCFLVGWARPQAKSQFFPRTFNIGLRRRLAPNDALCRDQPDGAANRANHPPRRRRVRTRASKEHEL